CEGRAATLPLAVVGPPGPFIDYPGALAEPREVGLLDPHERRLATEEVTVDEEVAQPSRSLCAVLIDHVASDRVAFPSADRTVEPAVDLYRVVPHEIACPLRRDVLHGDIDRGDPVASAPLGERIVGCPDQVVTLVLDRHTRDRAIDRVLPAGNGAGVRFSNDGERFIDRRQFSEYRRDLALAVERGCGAELLIC